MSQRLSNRGSRAGFTLVEVMLALALGVMLLAGVVTFMSNMSLLYISERSAPQPYAHGDNLLRFLETTLNRAEPFSDSGRADPSENQETLTTQVDETVSDYMVQGSTRSRTQQSSEQSTLSWQQLPDAPPGSDPLLAFRYSEPLAPVESTALPLYERICFLEFQPGDGLMLIWYPVVATEPPEETIRRTLLSEHVTEVIYRYYDRETERWETLDSFLDEESTRPIPQVIELTVKIDEDKTRKLVITLPTGGENNYPIY